MSPRIDLSAAILSLGLLLDGKFMRVYDLKALKVVTSERAMLPLYFTSKPVGGGSFKIERFSLYVPSKHP